MDIKPFEYVDFSGRSQKVSYFWCGCGRGLKFSGGFIPKPYLLDFILWLNAIHDEIKRRDRERTKEILKLVVQESSLGYPPEWNYNPDGDLGPFQMGVDREHRSTQAEREEAVRQSVDNFLKGLR